MRCFVCERNNFILNPVINFEPMRRLENWRFVMKLRSWVTARKAALRTSCGCFFFEERFQTSEMEYSTLEWIKEVLMVQAVEWSMVLRMHLRSRFTNNHRIWYKPVLETEEMPREKLKFLSKMACRSERQVKEEHRSNQSGSIDFFELPRKT